MSGGHFDYKYDKIYSMAQELQLAIDQNNQPDEFGYTENFSQPTLDRLQLIQALLKKSAQLAKAAEWLYSGDDGEETFMERTDSYFKKKATDDTLL